MRRKKKSPKKKHTRHPAREPVVVSANEHSVDAILRTSPPVGVNYYAISPEETFTSVHELKEVTFERIFDVGTVEDFAHWFPNDNSIRGAQQNHLPIWSSMLSDSVAAATSEGLMNAAIQRSLVENISNVGGLTINADNAKTNPGLVNEKQLWNLFNTAYGEEETHQIHTNGLPISLQSKPDFAIWSKSNMVLLIGEGKNQRKYDFVACRRQAAAYMLAHLFHWIVPKSKAVEGVYGVAFCGPNCTGMESMPYKAALLRLSLPIHAGGKLQLQQFIISKANNDNLNLLWKFANQVCQVNMRNANNIQIGKKCPARLLLSRETLCLNPQEVSSDWEMVENGTAFLVIRLKSQEGFEYISSLLELDERAREDFALDFGESGVSFPCFLKVKNYLGSNEPNLDYFVRAKPRRPKHYASDLQDAYKMGIIGQGSASVIVVANMGQPIAEYYAQIDRRTFFSQFVELMERTVELETATTLNHGDIHVGNLVCSPERLSLIDFDEGQSKFVTARKPRSERQKRIHVADLRNTPISFTKNQLVNLFCECWILFFQSKAVADGFDTRIDLFVESYHSFFMEGQSPDEGQILQLFNELIQLLQADSFEGTD